MRFLREHRADIVNELTEWVGLRSVNGDPESEPDLIRSANWLAGALRATGFPTVDVWRIEGAPAVYAKGHMLTHIWGIRAHLAATGRTAPAVNLKLVIEGEEESGSAHLSDALDKHRDLVVFSDTLTCQADHPAVCTSLRCMVSAELRVMSPLRDVHSGAVSGPAVNPAIELSALIGAPHDDQGRIMFPGFYDDVEDLTEARRPDSERPRSRSSCASGWRPASTTVSPTT